MPSVAEAASAAKPKRKPREPTHRERAQAFYASRAWHALRYRVLAENAKRHGGVGRCELCGRSRADGAILHCDHIEPLSKNWDRRLDAANIQVFCDACNLGKSNKDDTDFRPVAEVEAAR